MKREIMDKLMQRANKKTKDGVYSYENYPYAVIEGKLRFVANFGKILELSHGFLVIIGSCEVSRAKTKIKELYNKVKRRSK